jgi:hypothetical protein
LLCGSCRALTPFEHLMSIETVILSPSLVLRAPPSGLAML